MERLKFKFFLFSNISIIFLVTFFSQPLYPQYSAIRVGILPFFDTVTKKSDSISSKKIVAGLVSSLSSFKFIKLIEKARMDKVLAEIQLGQTGLIRSSTAVKAGQIHGIAVMILGTITNRIVYTRAIYIQTGQIISSAQSKGFLNFDSLSNEIAADIEVFLAKEKLKNLKNDSPNINLDFSIERISGKRHSKIVPGKMGKAKIGETIIFHLKSNLDGFLTIVDIQPGGDVVILFPNDLHPDNKIIANRQYSIPSKEDGFTIIVSEPEGIDTVVAFFTKKKVQWLDRKKLTGKGFWTVKNNEKLNMARGFQIQATKLSTSEWESNSIEINVSRN